MGLFSFRRLDLDPLALSMSGVKLGERLLQIGVDDATLAGRIAAKTGLSGSASHAVGTDDDAVRVNRGAKRQACWSKCMSRRSIICPSPTAPSIWS
jgi:hypothetical protein